MIGGGARGMGEGARGMGDDARERGADAEHPWRSLVPVAIFNRYRRRL